MEKKEKISFKDKIKEAVETAKTTVSGVDFSTAKEKVKEVNETAKEAVKKVKLPEVDTSKIKDVFKKTESYILVQLSGSKVKILLPKGYEKIKHKNILKDFTSDDVNYHKAVSTSDNMVYISKLAGDKAMNPDDVDGLINDIHQKLSDTQGLVEVKNGETRRGYKYIYCIIKNLIDEQFGGMKYLLCLNLFYESEVIEVTGEFTEINLTGQREGMCSILARKAGLIEMSSEGFKGLYQDPYDPNYTKGCLKNLTEKEGLDGLFPDNPLSQTHELLLAIINDELIDDSNPKQNDETVNENELFTELFVDECKRKTCLVEIKEFNEQKENAKQVEDTSLSITAISTRNAIKIIYYLMAVDGQIFHEEEAKFDLIGKELDPNYSTNKEQIMKECQFQLDKVIDPEDYYDTLQDGVEEALMSSKITEDTFITPKLLVWDLLTIAYSDESYDEKERKLIKYIVRKLNIDKTIFLEMESSILTLIDIEKEIAWIKTTNKPYLTIEAMVNELADRKNVIFESIKDLISL